jgi:hypothetical protein
MNHPTMTPSDPAVASLTWRKSSYSNGAGGMCVEVARLAENTAVRDSKNPEDGILMFSPPRWSAFLEHTRATATRGAAPGDH